MFTKNIPGCISGILILFISFVTFAQENQVNTILKGHWDKFLYNRYTDVWFYEDHAYIGTFDRSVNSVFIVDISDPANPRLVSEYRSPDISPPDIVPESMKLNQVLGNGNVFALHENDRIPFTSQDVKVANGLLFIGHEGDPRKGVSIVDVRNPSLPKELATIRISELGGIHNTFYDNGYLYIVDSGTPIVAIVDLTVFDPDNVPETVITETKWILKDVGTSLVHDITVQNGRMYASAGPDGLWIYDVRNIANEAPRFLGFTLTGNFTHSCWPTDDGKYVVTGDENPSVTGLFNGIKVFRIIENGDSITMVETDRIALDGKDASSVHNQFVKNYRVYNSWYEAGLRVYDINPASGKLTFVGSYDTYPFPVISPFYGAWGVHAPFGDHKIFISDVITGLHIIAIDCNSNGIEDKSDIVNGTSEDCTGNGIPDECEPDCNGNQVADSCDIDSGFSKDVLPIEGDGIPDECENDCNGNLIPDLTDNITNDCNGNSIPDDCDIGNGDSEDCTGDGIPDECEPDCNGNQVADSCDIDSGFSIDVLPMEGDGIPDGCQEDCNNNQIPDLDDIALSISKDCNNNNIPDECDLVTKALTDCNNNGESDECEDVIIFEKKSRQLFPIDSSNHQTFTFFNLPKVDPASGVTFQFEAFGDFNETDEIVTVFLNGKKIEELFTYSIDVEDCIPLVSLSFLNGKRFNKLLKNGRARFDFVASSAVDPEECEKRLMITVTISYEVDKDCNNNGILDECDISSGNSQDRNNNGQPDSCDII